MIIFSHPSGSLSEIRGFNLSQPYDIDFGSGLVQVKGNSLNFFMQVISSGITDGNFTAFLNGVGYPIRKDLDCITFGYSGVGSGYGIVTSLSSELTNYIKGDGTTPGFFPYGDSFTAYMNTGSGITNSLTSYIKGKDISSWEFYAYTNGVTGVKSATLTGYISGKGPLSNEVWTFIRGWHA